MGTTSEIFLVCSLTPLREEERGEGNAFCYTVIGGKSRNEELILHAEILTKWKGGGSHRSNILN